MIVSIMKRGFVRMGVGSKVARSRARVCYEIIWASAPPLVRFVIFIFRCSLGFVLLMKIGKPLILAMPWPFGVISTMSTSYSSPILIG